MRVGGAMLRLLVLFSLLSIVQPAIADERHSAPGTIKIGLFGPLTGASSIFAKTVYGAAAIYKDINEKGGIDGRKIEVVLADDACDAKKGVEAVKNLISQDHVFALHGAVCTDVSLAVAKLLENKPHVPWMIMTAASDAAVVPVRPYIFHGAQTSSVTANQMVEFALTKPGVKRVAIISQSDDWGQATLKPALETLKSHGLAPVIVLPIDRNAASASKEAQEIKSKSPDVVIAILYPQVLAVYMRDAYREGLKVTTVGHASPTLEDTDKRIGIPGAIDGLFLSYRLSGTPASPALAKYLRIFKTHYPAEAPDAHAFYAMGGALAIVEALKRSGKKLTRERFISELDKIKNFDTGIMAGPISFSKTDHIGVKVHTMSAMFHHRVIIVKTFGEMQNLKKAVATQ